MNLNELSEKINRESLSEIRQFMHSLLENKYLILLITLLVMVIAGGYAFTKPALYEGNILIQVDEKSQDNLKLQQFHMGSSTVSAVAFQSALIQSRIILAPIVKELGLDIAIEANHLPYIGHFFARRASEEVKFAEFVMPDRYINQHLKMHIIDQYHYQLVNQNKEIILTGQLNQRVTEPLGFIVDVAKLPNVNNQYFNVIKLPTNRIINRVLDNIEVRQFGDVKDTQTGILQITYRDTDPKRLATILNMIAQRVQAKSMERRSQESAQTLRFLNEQIPIVRGALEGAEAKLNEYRAKSGKIDIKMITEQMMEKIASIEKQIVDSQLAKSTLLQAFTEKYPPIIELNYKIGELKKLKTQWIKKLKTLPATDQVAINLMRDAKVKNDLYLILLNKIQELKVVSAGTLSDVCILEATTPPESALPAQISLTLLASFILGLMLGIVIVLVKKTLQRRVADPTWTERAMNILNLAVVPYSAQQTKAKKLQKKSGTSPILAEQHPQDLSIEALRSLRTSFTMFSQNAHKKIINITGISSGIGKSFISLNFACLLADLGKKILLIDGDLRRGSLHTAFALQQTPGLNELINQSVSLADTLKPTKVDNLYFISCGTYPVKSADLFMKNNFKTILAGLKEEFDYIVIDTAPVLAVVDSTIIALAADVTFLVLGSDVHRPEEIILTVKRLENAGVSINGTIFNNLSKKTSLNSKYQYHYYSTYGENAVESIK